MTDAKKMRELADRLWGYAADCDTDGMPEQANDLRTASTTLRTASNQLTAGTSEGWKLVPDQPDEAMWQAGRSADEHPGDSYTKVYCAMIEAAPALTAGTETLDLESVRLNLAIALLPEHEEAYERAIVGIESLPRAAPSRQRRLRRRDNGY